MESNDVFYVVERITKVSGVGQILYVSDGEDRYARLSMRRFNDVEFLTDDLAAASRYSLCTGKAAHIGNLDAWSFQDYSFDTVCITLSLSMYSLSMIAGIIKESKRVSRKNVLILKSSKESVGQNLSVADLVSLAFRSGLSVPMYFPGASFSLQGVLESTHSLALLKFVKVPDIDISRRYSSACVSMIERGRLSEFLLLSSILEKLGLFAKQDSKGQNLISPGALDGFGLSSDDFRVVREFCHGVEATHLFSTFSSIEKIIVDLPTPSMSSLTLTLKSLMNDTSLNDVSQVSLLVQLKPLIRAGEAENFIDFFNELGISPLFQNEFIADRILVGCLDDGGNGFRIYDLSLPGPDKWLPKDLSNDNVTVGLIVFHKVSALRKLSAIPFHDFQNLLWNENSRPIRSLRVKRLLLEMVLASYKNDGVRDEFERVARTIAIVAYSLLESYRPNHMEIMDFLRILDRHVELASSYPQEDWLLRWWGSLLFAKGHLLLAINMIREAREAFLNSVPPQFSILPPNSLHRLPAAKYCAAMLSFTLKERDEGLRLLEDALSDFRIVAGRMGEQSYKLGYEYNESAYLFSVGHLIFETLRRVQAGELRDGYPFDVRLHNMPLPISSDRTGEGKAFRYI